MEQVLVSLAVNARDAMPEGGKLTIATANVDIDEDFARQNVSAVPGPHVTLTVSDTGTGMDAQVQAHLFELFFTAKDFRLRVPASRSFSLQDTRAMTRAVWGRCMKVPFSFRSP